MDVRDKITQVAKDFASCAQTEITNYCELRNERYDLDLPASFIKAPLPSSVIVYVTKSQPVAVVAGRFSVSLLHLSHGARVGKVLGTKARVHIMHTGQDNERFMQALREVTNASVFSFYECVRRGTDYYIKTQW